MAASSQEAAHVAADYCGTRAVDLHVSMHGLLRLLRLSQSIVLGASRDSAWSHIYGLNAYHYIYGFMPLRRFLLADRPAPEAICPLASQLLFGDPLRIRAQLIRWKTFCNIAISMGA
jgi:hypothetical protein